MLSPARQRFSRKDEPTILKKNFPQIDPNSEVKLPWTPYMYAGVASLCTFAYGFNIGIIAVALLSIQRHWSAGSLETAFIVSSMLAGAILGSVFATHEGAGRKPMLLGSCALLAVGALASAFSPNVFVLIVSRFVVGIGVGVASIMPGLLITELSPATIRGQLGVFNQIAGFVGIVASYCVGLLMIWMAGAEANISFMLFMSAAVIAAISFVLASMVLPESPRWLVKHGYNTDALSIVQNIYGPANVHQSLAEYAALAESHKNDSTSPKTALPWRLWWLVLGLQLAQQAAGSGFLTYYAAAIFRSWGLSAEAAVAATLLSALPQLALFLVSLRWGLIETMGRKRLLLLSAGSVALVLAGLGVISLFGAQLMNLSPLLFAGLLVLGLTIHRVAYALGLAPVPTVLIAESVPFGHRSRVLSVALTLNWTLNFLLTTLIPSLAGDDFSTNLGMIYLALAVAGVGGFIFISHFVKETRGLALEAAEEMHLVPVLLVDPVKRSRIDISGLAMMETKALKPPPIPQLRSSHLEV